MKFSNKFVPKLIFRRRNFMLVGCILISALAIAAQKRAGAEFAAAASLEQCRNGSTVAPVSCDASGWIAGDATSSNAHWSETHFISYRMLFSGLTAGSHTVVIGYDILNGSKHVVDYLGSFNATETSADPCSGVAGCILGSPTSTIPVPTDTVTVTAFTNPNTGQPVSQIPGVFTMWGGTLTSVTYLPYGGGAERQIQITFDASVADPVIAWGGHISWVGDWGFGNSGRGIAGSPYQMRLIDLDGQGGFEVRSLSTDSVFPSGAVWIKKEVFTLNGSNSSNTSFPFSATSNLGPTAFSLVDDNAGPGNDFQNSQAIDSVDDAYTITVTEGNTPGWSLLDVNCTENLLQDSTKNGLGPSATIVVQEGEVVVCTFQNSQLVPSAAPASVSGRVSTFDGSGIRGAALTLINLNTGETRTAISSSFGYYSFDDLTSTDFYVLSIISKRYRFPNSTVSFTLNDSIANLDFLANP